MTEPQPVLLRDRIAWRICNWVLRHVASDWYQSRIEGTIRYGLAAMARDLGWETPDEPH